MPQYELNLRDYLRIFRKRRLTIFITFLVVTIGSVIYVSNLPVVYQATATVKIEERKTIAGLLTEWILYNPGDIMESETRIIKSYSIMKNVALRMGKVNDSYSLEKINNVIDQLQANIETDRVSSTNMIRITATAVSAREAMDLANTVAKVYMEENLAEKAKQARHARQFIQEQLSSLEKRLSSAEESLREFGDEVKNIRMAGPIQEKLLALEFELAELSQKYTEKHPRVVQIKEQVKELESQIKGFSGQELEYVRLNREIEVNKKLYAMLKEKLEEARITEAQKVADVSIVNPAVLPASAVSGNKQLGAIIGAMLGLILGFGLTFVFEALDTSIATIEDVEAVVKLRVLGVVPSIKQELMGKKRLLEALKEKFIAAPSTEAEQRFISLVAHYKPQSPTAEAFRNIHTNLKLNSTKKTIMVTSSSPREGKSTVVTNLGIVMAQTGLNTLLVSTDLRRPILAKTFGIKKEPGLNDLIMGTANLDVVLNNITDILLGEIEFEDIRKTPGIENIWVITAGHLPSNPVELLDSKELKDIIETLKSRFDVIIFDTPPVLPVTDASILASKMDCTVIVYEIGKTSREALLRAKVQLESVGAKIAGIILNHTRPQTEAIASYPYYYRYKYRYYTETASKKKEK